MRIDIDRQRRLYRRHGAAAAERLRALLDERVEELVELGFERAFSTVGVHEYGDSTYFKDDASIEAETLEELADAIFYLHVPIARAAGELPETEG